MTLPFTRKPFKTGDSYVVSIPNYLIAEGFVNPEQELHFTVETINNVGEKMNLAIKKCPRCEKYGNPVEIRSAVKKETLYYICEWCGWKLKEAA